MTMFRRVTKDDKPTIEAMTRDAGIKVRIACQYLGLRVCLVGRSFTEGNRARLVDILNECGFRTTAGQEFSLRSFNQPHEIFVRTAAVE